MFELKGLTWRGAQETAQKYLPFFEKHAPELLEEMDGIAQAVQCSLTEIIALNVRNEILSWGGEGCTSIGAMDPATNHKDVIIGQNWDQRPQLGLGVFRIHQPPNPTVLMAVEPGMIGKFGLNSAGIGLVVNLLSWTQSCLGMPIRALQRRVLDCVTLEQAVDLIKGEWPSYAFAFIIGSGDEGVITGVELTPQGVHLFSPEEGVIAHTNHFLANPGPWDIFRRKLPDTLQRLDRARDLLSDLHGKIGLNEVGSVLKDHHNYPRSICRHLEDDKEPPMEWTTLASLVLDLRGRKMYLAHGHPCCTRYVDIGVFEEEGP